MTVFDHVPRKEHPAGVVRLPDRRAAYRDRENDDRKGGLGVAASAYPPDPTWIAGFWDDDDQDTAVIAVLSSPGWVAPAGPSFVTFLIVDPLAVMPMRPAIRTSVLVAVESRGPPLTPK